MAGKTTVALTTEQVKEIINTMRLGGAGFHANERIATCLLLEANLGVRISDILKLRLSDIIKDGSNYRLNIIEKKTGKKRTFLVPLEIFQFLQVYCLKHGILDTEIIFPIRERTVQKYLKTVVDYLGIENIGTHSFRKCFATDIYDSHGHDIELVRELLQHSSVKTTQRYIKRSPEKLESAIRGRIILA